MRLPVKLNLNTSNKHLPRARTDREKNTETHAGAVASLLSNQLLPHNHNIFCSASQKTFNSIPPTCSCLLFSWLFTFFFCSHFISNHKRRCRVMLRTRGDLSLRRLWRGENYTGVRLFAIGGTAHHEKPLFSPPLSTWKVLNSTNSSNCWPPPWLQGICI